jgi:arsenate reductase
MRLYHNPRCSKSRQALALLNESGVEFEEYRYLELGIAEEDLEILSSLTGIIRTNEQEFKSGKFDVNNTELVKEALKKTPKLLQRPVLITSGKAVIGRPPEDIKSII